MELGPIEILVGFAAVILILYYWSTSTYNFWKNLGVPGPTPIPIFGNTGSVLLRQQSIAENQYELHMKWRHVPFYGVYDARLPILIVNDLELIKNILIKDFNAFGGRGVPIDEKDDPLAGHIFNIDGHRWRVLRAKLSRAFSSGKLKQTVELMIKCAGHFETYLRNQIKKGDIIECREASSRYTTDVIGTCAFGIGMNALNNDDSQFRKLGREMFQNSFYHHLRRLFRDTWPSLYKLLGVSSLSSQHIKFFVNSITETMEYREKNNIIRDDLIDIFINMKQNQKDIDFEITNALLTSQAFGVFVAGFETSSTTIAFALYELAIVPEIQEKLRAEILEVLKKNNGQLSYESINQMKYLTKVLYETLRKNSPTMILRRKSDKSYPIPGCNVIIPEGTMVNIPIYSIHHDERYFPKPELFDPERFSEENINARHQMLHLPFGNGPKRCIASRFAIHQAKLGIIAVIKNFKISPSKLTKIPYEIDKSTLVLTAAGGIHLKFEPLLNTNLNKC